MIKKIFVIGSNSFSGSSFIAQCLSLGIRVLGLSRSKELPSAFLPYKWVKGCASEELFEFKQLDLNHDTSAIAQALETFRSEYVVNFAAQSMVAESWEHPAHWYQTNVVGNVKFHDRIRQFDFLKRYVHVSTPEVYGHCSGKVTETHPLNPSTPYAASRAACDMHLMTFFRQYQFPVVFTRAANVYGPGQQLYRIIPRAILYILLKKKIPLHGGGHSIRSFIHIRDVAKATLAIAERGILGNSYHISTNTHVSIRQLVEMIAGMMGVAFEDAVEVVDERPGKDAAYVLDSTKLRQDLGWEDIIGLEEGLQETIRWVSDNKEALKSQPLEYVHKE